MPAALDRCVTKLLAKWKADPKSRPKPRMVDGKPQKARSQAYAICTAGQKKMEGWDPIMLEGLGPAFVGAAVTNRPHIKGMDPVTIVGEGDEQRLRVPLLILGKWRHPRGPLEFNESFVARMRKNFADRVVGHDISLDNRHKPELGALGWFEKLEIEKREDERRQVVGYADPTPAGIQAVKERRYRYSSMEFVPDYTSPLMVAFSTDQLEEWREDMSDPIDVAEGTEALEAQLLEAKEALELEQAQREQLEQQMQRLETRTAELEARRFEAFVDNILLRAEAYRDTEGRAHSKPLMDWAKAALLEKPLGEEDSTIQLEDKKDVTQVRAYYRRAVGRLLETLPGVVPMTPAETERDEARRLEGDEDPEPTKEQTDEFWGVEVSDAV